MQARLRRKLDWTPKTSFENLVRAMVSAEFASAKAEQRAEYVADKLAGGHCVSETLSFHEDVGANCKTIEG
jgi:hypothetical protein